MTTAYIAFGSNLGDRGRNIQDAHRMLNNLQDTCVCGQSSIYETDPVGGPRQGLYLNGVWHAETQLDAADLMQALLEIEKKLGRVRTEANAPRTIDLDILFYGDQLILSPQLKIPHPRLHERLFVLKPLNELCPDFNHPAMNKTVSELLNALQIQESAR